jgi:cobalt/nickel transport system permease protein
VVLMVQALLMADGGITALGTNIVLMALAGCFLGYLCFRVTLRVLPRQLASVAPAAGIAGLVSVPLVAAVFTLLFALGGTAPIDAGDVLVAMLGWHTLIGIGEGLVTGLVVGAVVASRPDLVHGAQGLVVARLADARTSTTAGEAAA